MVLRSHVALCHCFGWGVRCSGAHIRWAMYIQACMYRVSACNKCRRFGWCSFCGVTLAAVDISNFSIHQPVCMVLAWCLLGGCSVDAWWLHGGCTVVAWCLHAGHMTVCKARSVNASNYLDNTVPCCNMLLSISTIALKIRQHVRDHPSSTCCLHLHMHAALWSSTPLNNPPPTTPPDCPLHTPIHTPSTPPSTPC